MMLVLTLHALCFYCSFFVSSLVSLVVCLFVCSSFFPHYIFPLLIYLCIFVVIQKFEMEPWDL